MKKILVIGAGLSASTMIKYFLDNAQEFDWQVTVGDANLETAQRKVDNHPKGKAIFFDIKDEKISNTAVSEADVVISFLPAFMHPMVANLCIKYRKHMVTASYVSNEMKVLDKEAQNLGLAFLNELGVDPGIDHMSAMKVMDEIKAKGGKLLAFKSNTGGLIAPEYDNNPWHYKFTWNPRNVVLAGQGTAQYIENGKYKFIPYQQLFRRTESAKVLHMGEFEVYPNRDSLKYREIYDIQNIPTLVRGTMRRPGYCEAWNVFVQLGMTDDTYTIADSANMTYKQFIDAYLPENATPSVQQKLSNYLGIAMNSKTMQMLEWLGIFDDKKIDMDNATPAQMLQKLLEGKLFLGKDDKDMIVMQHQFDYELNGKKKRILSSMVVIGKDTTHTAMSITVGTPVAIATKLLLTGKIKVSGVKIPVTKDLYEPILAELEPLGIKFIDEEFDI